MFRKYIVYFSVILTVFIIFKGYVVSPVFSANQPLLKILDTTAGQPALIMVNGSPTEVIELTITNPFKAVIRQKFKLNETGILQYWYQQAVIAGEYRVEYKGEIASFFVTAGLPDREKSQFEISDYTASIGQLIEGRVVLKDRFGNLIKGKLLDLSVKGSAGISCSNDCRTNQHGIVRFTITSQKPGLKKLTILDHDAQTKIFQEDLGFLPIVSLPAHSTPKFFYESIPDQEYIPIFDPLKANANARGNDDRLKNVIPSSFTFLSPDILKSQLLSQENTITTQTVALQNAAKNTGFEIIMGIDKKINFQPEVKVSADSALDFLVRAIDEKGLLKKNYTGEIGFTIEPSIKLPPTDYQFTALDQGEAVFELALVLPAGQYTMIVQDKNSQALKGEVKIIAQRRGVPNLNNTNLILTIDSPIENSFYSKSVSIQGSTNMDNTEIVVQEGGSELKRVSVDANKKFSFLLDMPDGKHQLDIIATYIVDGSQTTTTINFEVDKTAPVIVKVYSDIPSVRAGDPFTMKVDAEEGATLKALMANRAYEFVGSGTSYTLTANAPLDIGTFPVTLQISDKFGNVETTPNAATLNVTEQLKEIQNLFGIPGMETITISWDHVQDAKQYEVMYQSMLGSSEPVKTEVNTATVEKLSANVSYVFTVIAKDENGNAVSLPTQSKALSPLAELQKETPAVVHAAADKVTKPRRHTKSGPEVYLLVIVSMLLLNCYGKLRKALAKIKDEDLLG